MKIVVTGGLGFIGKNFARYVRGIPKRASIHAVDWFGSAPPQDHEIFDSSTVACFASETAKKVYAGADVIVHLAATTTVQDSLRDPKSSFENNVVKTQRLLDHVLDVAPRAHFVFASTGGAIIGDYSGPIHEGVAPRPVSPYGATKLAVEGLLSAYSGSFGLSSAALRFSNVYGPNSERKSSVVAKFCQEYLVSRHLKINGDGQQTRDYIYVDDICKAIWLTIDTRANGVFQLGTGVGTSILDLVDIIQAVDPLSPITVSHGPGLRGEVKHNVCNITRARDELGFLPEFDLKRGVDKTLAWFQARHA